ncbi:MFS transporter [Nocardiopsis sp. L17-MgMaSL7]|uniref:MFS transporter n=1 Tax=Nocardiopsis sp. L17-MgMaSL7 TaxID=1938893 RepID=UPI000D712C8B|nr:MFS transporter [Nocardiopsis sp. L17-MgMaSL7]PWV52323.1 putative MFS family arabinose efflux permease [Nocardiopsis sp. L17-MgMaSL7]
MSHSTSDQAPTDEPAPSGPQPPPPEGRRFTLLARLSVFTLISTTADFAFGAVFVTVILARGADPWAVGLILAGGHLIGLVMEAPSGALGDRYGHRRLLTLGLLVWGSGFVALGLADGLVFTVVGVCLGNIGMSLKSGTLNAILINRTGPHDRNARITRIVRVGAVSTRMGSVLGAASVMVAGTWLSAGTMIAVGGVLVLLLGLLAPVCFPATPGQPDRRIGAIVLESVVLVASRRFLPPVVLALSLMVATMLLVVSWQPMLLAQYGDDDVRLNGLVLLLMSLSLAAGAACARWVHQDRPHVWGALLSMGIGLPLVLAAHGVVPLVAGLVAAEFLIGLGGVLSGAWCQLMFTDANRNTMFSAVTVVTLLGSALTSSSFGWLWDLWGIPVAVSVLAVFALVLASAALVLTRLLPESTDFTWAVRRNEDAARGRSAPSC